MKFRIEIANGERAQDFLDVPKRVYANDQEYIPHITQDIKNVFNAALNPFCKNGEIQRWVAYDENNQAVGRVAAGYQNDEDMGRVGFFEALNDPSLASQLLTAAEQWLKEKGYNTVQGPVNFGSRDSFWGLLVEGFKRPSYRENYNPKYYKSLFEAAGYQEDFKQTTSEITRETFNFERFSRLASRVFANEDYTFKHLDYSKVDQFADDFVHIYNTAWKQHDFYKPLKKEALLKDMKKMKAIAPAELNWFVYANGEPAGFYINVLDVNQVFKHVNGKLNLWGKLKFLYYKPKIDRVRGIVFGVIPQYQNKGLETGMIMKYYEELINMPTLKSSELSWIGDFNPKMQSLFNSLGAETSKVHLTMKKEI